ncbi:MAG: D-hexose-6-phosphate mutarotase [Gammaproteobacteria bacterium]|nr:D-hexose-6-phosphate mutarotase [Gammaproteobacteria bacterium]
MTTAVDLNQRFGLDGVLSFSELPNGFVVATVRNAHAGATIAMQGAHLMSFQPTGAQPLIWLSPEAKLAEGKSIRGGVPVCWPWFGPHESEKGFPAHGFARTVPWRLNQVDALSGGETRLEFELIPSSLTRSQWPYPCAVRNIITVGKTLRHELVTTNLGSEALLIGEALHTYFQVGDLRRVTVNGLQGCDYLDKVNAFARVTQEGTVSFSGEVDRIYLDTPSQCEIRDPAMQRRIVIRASGSRSTVVWTPWAEKGAQMGDLGPEGYLNMLCVETANAAEDTVTIAPGAQHRLSATYAIEAL